MSQTSHRPPGRPRDTSADAAILQATRDVLAEVGPSGLTIDAVAERAGVARATVYRRHASKDDLVLAAVEAVYAELPTLGMADLRDDLIAMVTAAGAMLRDSSIGAALPHLAGELGAGTPLGTAYLNSVLRPRQQMIAERIARAITDGDVRADVNPNLAVAGLVGPVMFVILSGATDELDPAALVDQLLDGLR
ncbi:TetR/AcrR family transcriptional regulator [Euzebya tangerina]|uniref:TetR/AcrR family transcriptional regulator n=1 Tax=Euzebya tangerina TaxID=591198 RepID=UPI000E30D928|nr:TetR/AcrR family transcriptional regulator [Euzebya tangerina]